MWKARTEIRLHPQVKYGVHKAYSYLVVNFLYISHTQFYPNQTENVEKLTFRGLCIVIYSYIKSQRDALFLNFILLKSSTCFGQTCCPSSGVLILYSQQ